MSKVDLNLFVVFNAIYNQQNLTRAADLLHVSQPAVSNALSRLRALFDDPLFVRGPGGMTPTPLARQLANPVSQALDTLDDCVRARLQFDPLNSRQTLRLHAAEQATALLLPTLLSRLNQSAPGMSMEIVFQNRREVPLALAAGDLHLAIDAPLLASSELVNQPLVQDHYVCVMRRNHPLAKADISLDDFLNTPQVHVSSRRRGSGHVDLALRSIGYQRHIRLRMPHYTVLPELLATSDYIAAAPRGLARHWPLHCCPLPFDTSPLELQMFWHKSSNHDPLTVWLREQVQSCLTQA